MDVRSTSLRRSGQALLTSGMDIRVWGLLFVVSGIVDLTWILAYPAYALKVFGTTFSGWVGDFVKYQHPVIHWTIGYGFWHKRRWALWGYVTYLLLACFSETMNQMVFGFHATRTTMVLLSVTFGTYVVARRHVFTSSPRMKKVVGPRGARGATGVAQCSRRHRV